MLSTTFIFQGKDGVDIFTRKWAPEDGKEVKGIVQIAHGMAEHSQRYEGFATFLVENGFVVYANDHRGHGYTAKTEEELGYFADENGFEKAANDLFLLTQQIEKENPSLPIFLFGHSMGSFLARRYMQLNGEKLKGLILSGTGGNPGILGKIGKTLANRECKKKGRLIQSPAMNKLIFGSYNRPFQPGRTEFDWLSNDETQVDKYMEDPLCGRIMTAGFYHDLLHGLEIIHQKSEEKKVPKEVPIYIFSGERDPVGNNGKGVLHVYSSLLKHGVKDVSHKLYPNGRHEMLNEVNKLDVYVDILKWLNEHMGQSLEKKI